MNAVDQTPNQHKPGDRLQVLIADDYAPYRHAIADVINAEPDMQVVAEASDGEQAVWLAQYLWPARLDLVLIDIEMPRLDGISAAARINQAIPNLPIVMLTVSVLDDNLFTAIRAGAIGYLSKDLAPAALIRALRDYHQQGALPMSRVMARKVLSFFQEHSERGVHDTGTVQSVGRLSPREREILELIARGARDREIGAQLVIAERTVKKHVESILRKLHARNRAEAAARLRDLQ
jgi:DNA-binding NarL/FixJ family response regulator